MLRNLLLLLAVLLPFSLVAQQSLYPTDYPFAPPTAEWNFYADVQVTPSGTVDTFNWLMPVRVFPSGNRTFQGRIHRRMAVAVPELDTLWQDTATGRVYPLSYPGFTDYLYVHQDTSGNLWLYDSLAGRHRLWVPLDSMLYYGNDSLSDPNFKPDSILIFEAGMDYEFQYIPTHLEVYPNTDFQGFYNLLRMDYADWDSAEVNPLHNNFSWLDYVYFGFDYPSGLFTYSSGNIN